MPGPFDALYSPFWGPPTGEEHCELSYMVTPYIAEFWSAMASLLFLPVGLFLASRALRVQVGPDVRLPCLFVGLSLAALLSFLSHATLNYSLERIDEAFFNALVLLVFYLTWEDSFLLMFYQIHAIVSTLLILSYPFLFHVHLALCVLALLLRFSSLCSVEQDWPLGSAGAASLLACLTFWTFERMRCRHPQPLHAYCQLFGFTSLLLAILLLQQVFSRTTHLMARDNPEVQRAWACIFPIYVKKAKKAP